VVQRWSSDSQVGTEVAGEVVGAASIRGEREEQGKGFRSGERELGSVEGSQGVSAEVEWMQDSGDGVQQVQGLSCSGIFGQHVAASLARRTSLAALNGKCIVGKGLRQSALV
jgi:hypothetical protein